MSRSACELQSMRNPGHIKRQGDTLPYRTAGQHLGYSEWTRMPFIAEAAPAAKRLKLRTAARPSQPDCRPAAAMGNTPPAPAFSNPNEVYLMINDPGAAARITPCSHARRILDSWRLSPRTSMRRSSRRWTRCSSRRRPGSASSRS